jgi:hypothetical protein
MVNPASRVIDLTHIVEDPKRRNERQNQMIVKLKHKALEMRITKAIKKVNEKARIHKTDNTLKGLAIGIDFVLSLVQESKLMNNSCSSGPTRNPREPETTNIPKGEFRKVKPCNSSTTEHRLRNWTKNREAEKKASVAKSHKSRGATILVAELCHQALIERRIRYPHTLD